MQKVCAECPSSRGCFWLCLYSRVFIMVGSKLPPAPVLVYQA